MSSRTTKGNIFRDLGKPKDVAENLVIRSQLMRAVQSAIKERGLTQEAAAELLGVDQPRMSNLKTGRLSVFSIDALVNMVVKLGLQVEVIIHQGQSVTAAKPAFRQTSPDVTEKPGKVAVFVSFATGMRCDAWTILNTSAEREAEGDRSNTILGLRGKIHGKNEAFTIH